MVALRTAIVYVVVLAGLRLFGKREMGELASFEKKVRYLTRDR